jgi:hypothetical protein
MFLFHHGTYNINVNIYQLDATIPQPDDVEIEEKISRFMMRGRCITYL